MVIDFNVKDIFHKIQVKFIHITGRGAVGRVTPPSGGKAEKQPV
jgi:hypothetical protein